MAKLLREIDYSKPIKIEVGSGGNPQPGYLHVDVFEGMPDLAAVCDMGKEALPFPDGCADEVLSNHSIEHVSWVVVDHVVKEWFRVLRPGGRLFLRTPDLRFICESYLAGKITREHPVDEGAMIRVFGDYTPSQWAVIKLFSGQSYPSNYHYLALDMESLTMLLNKTGFVNISRLNVLPVFSPGEIQCEAFKPL